MTAVLLGVAALRDKIGPVGMISLDKVRFCCSVSLSEHALREIILRGRTRDIQLGNLWLRRGSPLRRVLQGLSFVFRLRGTTELLPLPCDSVG